MFMIPEFSALQSAVSRATQAEVLRALSSNRPGMAGLAALLSPVAEPHLGAMAKRSAAITSQRFGRTMQMYAPVYLSSFCANRCAYCGFSADNTITRRVLTFAEAESDAMILHQRGFSHLLLVSGEAPAKVGVDYLEKLALRLRGRFAALSIEVQPLAIEEYARLFRAGMLVICLIGHGSAMTDFPFSGSTIIDHRHE